MKKLALILVLFGLIACQDKTTEAEKVQTHINNQKTKDHVRIPGTRLSVIPPQSFQMAENFTGLEKGEIANFNVFDFGEGEVESGIQDFKKSEFEAMGAEVFEFEDIEVNGFNGKYILMQGNPTFKTFSVIFGDDSFTTMVNAAFPAEDEITESELIQTLNSMYFEKDLKVDPFEMTFFTLDDSDSPFKFQKLNASIYTYTIDGKPVKDTDEEPLVIVSPISVDALMEPEHLAEMMMTSSQQYGLEHLEIKNESYDKINDYRAYQAEVSRKVKDADFILYYAVLIKGQKAVILQGKMPETDVSYMEDFKKMAYSLQIE